MFQGATIIGFNTVCISTQYIYCRHGNVRSLPANGSGLINHQTRLYLLSRFGKQQFDLTCKGHLNVTPHRAALDLSVWHIRKGEAIKELIFIYGCDWS